MEEHALMYRVNLKSMQRRRRREAGYTRHRVEKERRANDSLLPAKFEPPRSVALAAQSLARSVLGKLFGGSRRRGRG